MTGRSIGVPIFASAVALFAASSRPLAAGPYADLWNLSWASVQAEVAIDALQRRVYRPEFSFSWPLAVLGRSRAFLDLSFLQRINGSQKGAIDFWVCGGVETRVSETISFEAGLRHFCRHLTSTQNPHVLNLNELVGRVWMRRGDAAFGLGFGPYIGGSRGYHQVMVFDAVLPGLLLPELSLESELKWTNFRDLYYEATASLSLIKGAELFIRAARDYDFPTAAYLGIRFRSTGAVVRYVDSMNVEAGAYPLYDTHKLLVLGGYRLGLLRDPARRFFIDFDFRTPLLSGDSFLAQFWPDRMFHSVEGQYEKTLPGGLYGAWYARYFVDMPVDKPVRFRSTLATGLLVRNETDFNRLDKDFRFELAAGYDFVFAYDVRVRLGAQAPIAPLFKLGAEFRLEANSERRTAEFKLFAGPGREAMIRPFVGIRKITILAGPPPGDPFRSSLMAGIAFYRWF